MLVNGMPAAAGGSRRTLFVEPDGPGFVRLTVIDAKGAADSVMVRVQSQPCRRVFRARRAL